MNELFGALLHGVTTGRSSTPLVANRSRSRDSIAAFAALVLASCVNGTTTTGEATEDVSESFSQASTGDMMIGGVCGTANENANVTLTCPSGTIQAVDFASYGTPTGSCGGFATSSCHATNSQSVVAGRCLGKRTCTVPATNAVFGDACPNVVKRLSIEASCGGGVCGTANENANVTLTCPFGTIQTVDFASYGTPTGSCGGFATSSCHATNSQSVVAGRCLGKRTCTVPATNAVFGDACPYVVKRLSIEASCGGSGEVSIAATTQAAEPSTNGMFTVSISSKSSTATVVSYTTSGTATAGSDYTALSGTVTIAAGASSATISVPVIDDAIAESTETVTITLDAITSGDPTLAIGWPSSAFITIASNDETGAPAEVTNLLAAPGNTLVALSWTEPGDADFAGIRLSRSPQDAVPIDIARGTKLHEATGLANGTEYTFLVQTYDYGGNVSAGVTVRATPSGTAPARAVTKRILHMRLRFSDDPAGYIPQPDAATVNEANRVKDDFYRASNGLARIRLTITPTLDVGHTHAYYSSACPTVDWPKMNQLIADARAAAGALGFDAVNQEIFAVRYNGEPGCCCAWGGSDKTWLRFFGAEHHEWCHNFNVGDEICKRSNNTARPLDPNRSDAGRNIWTPVGAETSPNLFFNVMDLATKMGMYTADNFHVPATSGVYRIRTRSVEPLNYHPKTKYGIKLVDAHHSYMIEYRTLSPFASDTTTPNGVLLFDEAGNCIDMTPATSSTQDAVLLLGTSVTSVDGAFTIRPVARGGAGATAYMDVEITIH